MAIKLPSKPSALYHYAEKYVNMKALFKDGKPKIRELNNYKIKKIRKALKTLIGMAGSQYYLERDFVKVRRDTRLKKYNKDIGWPAYAGGVTINGGAKHNTNVRISKDLHLVYVRGVYDVLSVPLDATTEKTLIKSIESQRHRIERSDATYIGSNGHYIIPSYREGRNPTDKIVEKSLYLYNKYGAMAAAGEERFYKDRFNKDGSPMSRGVAQPMTRWGFSLMFQEKIENV